jgi:hypothetical protein
MIKMKVMTSFINQTLGSSTQMQMILDAMELTRFTIPEKSNLIRFRLKNVIEFRTCSLTKTLEF